MLEDKAIVNAEDAVRSIRSGMTDEALTEKYELSQKGLGSLFRKLVAAGAIVQSDLDRRRGSSSRTRSDTAARNPRSLANVEEEGEEGLVLSSEDRSIWAEYRHNSPRLAGLLWEDWLLFSARLFSVSLDQQNRAHQPRGDSCRHHRQRRTRTGRAVEQDT